MTTAPAADLPPAPDSASAEVDPATIPGFLAINGRSLALLLLALPAGAMALFGLEAAEQASYGALAGWGLGLLDLLLTGWFLRRARKRPDDFTAAIRLVGASMIARLVVAGLVFLVLRRVAAVNEATFLVAFVLAHIIAISGWVWQQAVDLRELLRTEATARSQGQSQS